MSWLIGALVIAAVSALVGLLWYNRPPPRRRKWRDRDEHEQGFIA